MKIQKSSWKVDRFTSKTSKMIIDRGKWKCGWLPNHLCNFHVDWSGSFSLTHHIYAIDDNWQTDRQTDGHCHQLRGAERGLMNRKRKLTKLQKSQLKAKKHGWYACAEADMVKTDVRVGRRQEPQRNVDNKRLGYRKGTVHQQHITRQFSKKGKAWILDIALLTGG